MSCTLEDLDREGQLFKRDGAGPWLALQVMGYGPGVVHGDALTLYSNHALLLPKPYMLAYFSPAQPEGVIADFIVCLHSTPDRLAANPRRHWPITPHETARRVQYFLEGNRDADLFSVLHALHTDPDHPINRSNNP